MHVVFAYVDPGSGSLLIQAAIAVIAGVVTVPMMLRRRISAFISRRNTKVTDQPETPPQER